MSDVHPGIIGEEVEFSFNVWREFSDRTVGIIPRSHFWDIRYAKVYLS